MIYCVHGLQGHTSACQRNGDGRRLPDAHPVRARTPVASHHRGPHGASVRMARRRRHRAGHGHAGRLALHRSAQEARHSRGESEPHENRSFASFVRHRRASRHENRCEALSRTRLHALGLFLDGVAPRTKDRGTGVRGHNGRLYATVGVAARDSRSARQQPGGARKMAEGKTAQCAQAARRHVSELLQCRHAAKRLP